MYAYCGTFCSMPRRIQNLSVEQAYAVTWSITLLILFCLSALVSGFVIMEFRNGSNANGG